MKNKWKAIKDIVLCILGIALMCFFLLAAIGLRAVGLWITGAIALILCFAAAWFVTTLRKS